jgi:ATP-dependent DNA helicase RecG
MISKKDAYLKQIQQLSLPLSCLKGVGPKRSAFFAQKGLHTILDLLFFTPLRYEDRTRITPISDVQEGIPALVRGKVVYGREERFYPTRKRLFKILIRDGKAGLELVWFNYRKPFLTQLASQGKNLLAYGPVRMNRGHKQMIHPDTTVIRPGGYAEAPGFHPVYSSIDGIPPSTLRSAISAVLAKHLSSLADPLSADMIHRLGLPSLRESIQHVHRPPKESSIDQLNQQSTPYHRRLLFDRFFLVMLIIAFRKKRREKGEGFIFSIPQDLMNKTDEFFPFQLTLHQEKVVSDIAKDFVSGKPMNRLVLGDVGCGKTAVAAVAAYICTQSRAQVAVMAPTQILAAQHLEYFKNLSAKMGFRPVLLTSGLRKGEREEIYRRIRNGDCNLVIGTQSLIQEDLVFSRLGLVIIDEQHRFGVRERALMDRKGENPHQMVMTATPIPRTLAMTVYGDMDVSWISEYPKGRLPVVTQLISTKEKRKVLEELAHRLSRGQQAFVICPVIEESEETDLKNAVEMADKLEKIFSPRFRVGLVHGRLPADERENIMTGFRKGTFSLLVGTTVVEVGVHVPKATVMIVEHPERFGLAQLHQLRGRVGRGSEQGVCFLMLSNTASEKAASRLEILVKSQDGPEIAQKDLELRGHGELIGIRQTGLGELDLADLMKEPALLSRAREEAQQLLDTDPELHKPQHQLLKTFVDNVLKRPLDL